MLLIDAYNLLLQPEIVPESVTAMDLTDLAGALKSSREYTRGITLVCDGRISGRLAQHHSLRTAHTGLRIVFSGLNRSADELILELVKHSSSRRNISVITNDRALGTDCRRAGTKVIGCASFLHSLASDMVRSARRSHTAASSGVSAQSLDSISTEAWLTLFGFNHDGSDQHADRPASVPVATPQADTPKSEESGYVGVPKPKSEPDPAAHSQERTSPVPNTQKPRSINPDLVQLFQECGIAIDLDDPELLQWLGSH